MDKLDDESDQSSVKGRRKKKSGADSGKESSNSFKTDSDFGDEPE